MLVENLFFNLDRKAIVWIELNWWLSGYQFNKSSFYFHLTTSDVQDLKLVHAIVEKVLKACPNMTLTLWRDVNFHLCNNLSDDHLALKSKGIGIFISRIFDSSYVLGWGRDFKLAV